MSTGGVPNAEEIAYWSGIAGSRWATFADQMDRAFAPVSAAGLGAAGARSGQAVLDIGSGCGATLLDLAATVGAEGNAVGVDVSERMLAVARERALARGLTNVRCVLADASTHDFSKAAFDLAFSRFGVMFFADPVGAFANVRRSLRPAGRLVFVCWRDLGANAWFRVPADAVAPYVAGPQAPDPQAPGPLAFADPGRIRRILERAGYENIEIQAFDAALPLGSRAAASDLLSQIGPAARLLADAGDEARAAAKAALDHALRAHERDGTIALGAGVWVVRARAERGARTG